MTDFPIYNQPNTTYTALCLTSTRSAFMSQTRYDLSNHTLRAKALEAFFTAQAIRNHFGRIANQENWFELELASGDIDVNSIEFQQLLLKLKQTCGVHLPLKSINLQHALQEIISLAETDNVFNQTACTSLLENCFNFDSIDFDEVSGRLSVPPASSAIANIFTTLHHPQLHATNTQLGVKLYDYLSTRPAAIFLVHKGTGQHPSIFLNNQFFPKEQVLLSEEAQADGSIQITPYMLVAQPTTPPDFHFLLDHSASMVGERLSTAKTSLIRFATILFQFEPRARLSINVFNEEYKALRTNPFLQADLTNGTLLQEINRINAYGGTNIARACRMKINEFLNNQNNVLLFTDGEDGTTDHVLLRQALTTVSPEQKVKNKFFIISFVNQPDVLQELTREFGSELFVEPTTQIQEVLAEHDQLQTWAASRDLFTTRVQVTQSINGETINQVYRNSMLQSNQVEALRPFTVQPGDEVLIEVTDSFNRSIVTARQIIGMSSTPPNSPQTRPISPGGHSIFHHNDPNCNDEFVITATLKGCSPRANS